MVGWGADDSPDAVSGEPGVELEGALLRESLHGAVDGALVGVLAVNALLHLLDTGLDEVEGQTADTCQGLSQMCWILQAELRAHSSPSMQECVKEKDESEGN